MFYRSVEALEDRDLYKDLFKEIDDPLPKYVRREYADQKNNYYRRNKTQSLGVIPEDIVIHGFKETVDERNEFPYDQNGYHRGYRNEQTRDKLSLEDSKERTAHCL